MKYIMLKIAFLGLLSGMSLSHTRDFTDWYDFTVSGHKFTEVKDVEPHRNTPGKDALNTCHPLLLNGKVFDDENFDIHSRGLLTMVEGRPESSEARLIPFRVSRKRKGMLLEEHAGATLEGKYELNLSLLLAHSHPGDQLIIYPIRKEHCKAKRVLRITSDKC